MHPYFLEYFDRVGGIELITRIHRHSLMCQLEAKSILQTWKEFYDYSTGEFSIEVSSEDIPLSLITGDKKQAVRKIRDSESPVPKKELESIQSSIPLIPEIAWLSKDAWEGLKINATGVAGPNHYIEYYYSPYKYYLEFDGESKLKTKMIITEINQASHPLEIRFEDWRRVDGLLYPFRHSYHSEFFMSAKVITHLAIELQNKF